LLLNAHVGGDRFGASAFVANCGGGLIGEFERAIGDHHGRAFTRAHYCGGATVADGEFLTRFRRSVCAAPDD
jgi:hypothetical protein